MMGNACVFGCIVVPFEEDDKDASIWFLDHNYHEAMFDMFKRINGSLRNLSILLIENE